MASSEKKRAEQNSYNDKIAKAGIREERDALVSQMRVLKETLQNEEEELKTVMKDWHILMLQVPNVPDMSVPDGESDADNAEIRTWGEKPNFDFEPKDHLELMTALKMVDFERGAKVHGFRGYFLTGPGVELTFAIWNYAMDFFKGKGFTPVIPPVIVRKQNLYGTGHLPGDVEDVKKVDPPPVKKTAPPKVEMKRFTPPVIKLDKEVEKTIPPVEELADAKISTDDQEGIKDDRVVKPTQIDEGKDIVEEKPAVEEDKTFEKVEIEASFPGGNPKWRQYLERNCNAQVATDNGAPEGTYTVVVQFVVDKEGNLSDVIALTNYGYGIEQEAVRVIKKGPKWNPAIQNGVQVKAYRKQLITFQVQSE
jgi:protein TonB